MTTTSKVSVTLAFISMFGGFALNPAFALIEHEDQYGDVNVRTSIGEPGDTPQHIENGAVIRIKDFGDTFPNRWFSFGCEDRGQKFYFVVNFAISQGIDATERSTSAVVITAGSESITTDARFEKTPGYNGKSLGMVGALDVPNLRQVLQLLAERPSDVRFEVAGEAVTFKIDHVPAIVFESLLRHCSKPVG